MKVILYSTLIFTILFIGCKSSRSANHIYEQKGSKEKTTESHKDRKAHEKIAKKRRQEIDNLHPNTINKKKKIEINTY